MVHMKNDYESLEQSFFNVRFLGIEKGASAEMLVGETNWIKIAKDICLYHHEKWDGSGYPFGKRGEEIPIEARIVALADTYDALRMQRSYKDACSHEQTCSILLEGDGRVMPSHFDPQIIEIYANHEDRMNEIYESSLETT